MWLRRSTKLTALGVRGYAESSAAATKWSKIQAQIDERKKKSQTTQAEAARRLSEMRGASGAASSAAGAVSEAPSDADLEDDEFGDEFKDDIEVFKLEDDNKADVEDLGPKWELPDNVTAVRALHSLNLSGRLHQETLSTFKFDEKGALVDEKTSIAPRPCLIERSDASERMVFEGLRRHRKGPSREELGDRLAGLLERNQAADALALWQTSVSAREPSTLEALSLLLEACCTPRHAGVPLFVRMVEAAMARQAVLAADVAVVLPKAFERALSAHDRASIRILLGLAYRRQLAIPDDIFRRSKELEHTSHVKASTN